MPYPFITTLCLSLSLSLSLTATAQEKHLRLGWTAWADAELVTRLAKQVLENHLDYRVEMVAGDVGFVYQAVANGEVDAMLMAWLPKTHGDYYSRYGGRLKDLGPVYEGVRLGWVTPDYVPATQLSSMADLAKPEVAARLRHRIQGIDPGAGLMRLSRQAMDAYGLDSYTLVAASGAGMAAALKRAISEGRWIVVTGWSPHGMFGRWPLRYLDDPQQSLGETEAVHVLARRGLRAEHPDAYAVLDRLRLSLDDVQTLMAAMSNTSRPATVARYLETHPEQVRHWLGTP